MSGDMWKDRAEETGVFHSLTSPIQQAAGTHLCLPSQYWGYKCVPPHRVCGVFLGGSVLMWVLGIEPWASCLHSQHFPDHLPALGLYR